MENDDSMCNLNAYLLRCEAASKRIEIRCLCLFLLVMVLGAPALPAAPPPTPPFTFAVFGDNRPSNETLPPTDVFKQILGEVQALHPAFVITTGDLIYGSAKDPAVVNREYDEVLPLIKPLTMPVYFATGNHEIRSSKANQDIYLKRVYPKLYYSFDYANCHLVVLDSDVVGQEHRIIGEQLAWFEKDLQQAQGKAKHIFVFEHQQPYPVSLHIGSSLDTYPADRDYFQSLLEKYHVEALITGHEHLYDDSIHGGVREIIAGGAGAPLYPSKRGGSFYNYVLVTIDGDHTYISVVKPGSLFQADKALTAGP